jgi:hypothetical protein
MGRAVMFVEAPKTSVSYNDTSYRRLRHSCDRYMVGFGGTTYTIPVFFQLQNQKVFRHWSPNSVLFVLMSTHHNSGVSLVQIGSEISERIELQWVHWIEDRGPSHWKMTGGSNVRRRYCMPLVHQKINPYQLTLHIAHVARYFSFGEERLLITRHSFSDYCVPDI